MQISVKENKYSVEECFDLLNLEESNNYVENSVFDEFGNYKFETDVILEKPNTIAMSNYVTLKWF